MQIRLTEAEYEAIERKFRSSGLRSRSDFIRAMIFEGYIVHFDEEKFDKIYKLIGSISNNVNQIAVRVNSTNKIYAEDIEEALSLMNYFKEVAKKYGRDELAQTITDEMASLVSYYK